MYKAEQQEAEPTSSSGSEESAGYDVSSEEDEDADVPFEELLQQKQDGTGLHGDFGRHGAGGAQVGKASKLKLDFKRENKNRPVEMTSKKPVPRFRDVMQLGSREVKDPRFEDLSGDFVEAKFKKQYAFMYDDVLPEERRNLRETLHKTKSQERKRELQAELTRVEQQLKAEQSRRAQDKLKAEHKKTETDSVKQGKRPYFLKKSEVKRQALIQKYNDLKAKGGLEKAILARRKKNAAKDHRYLPSERRQS